VLDNSQIKGRVFVGDSIVLICAVLASLASGVVLAYAVCLAMFSFLRTHKRQLAGQRMAVSEASAAKTAALEG